MVNGKKLIVVGFNHDLFGKAFLENTKEKIVDAGVGLCTSPDQPFEIRTPNTIIRVVLENSATLDDIARADVISSKPWLVKMAHTSGVCSSNLTITYDPSQTIQERIEVEKEELFQTFGVPTSHVIDMDVSSLYPNIITSYTTLRKLVKPESAIAREVIAGKWGNGSERKRRLTQAGYDYDAIQKLVNRILAIKSGPAPWDKMMRRPEIKKVHFSGPVTCVIWMDGTKTVVRCKDGEKLDPEKGLAMAIAKKVLGTNETGSNYYDEFKKWLPKDEAEGESK